VAAAAVAIAAEYGADLAAHHSMSLDRHLAVQADYLVCMTDSHLQAVLAQFPHLACQPRLLNPAGQDLPDPIGQDESVYRACAEQIWRDLEPLVDELAL
jgi:protein arginine phosphatase